VAHERIDAELWPFTEGRAIFPAQRESRQANQGALLAALRRHGEVARWAARLGLPRRELLGWHRRGVSATTGRPAWNAAGCRRTSTPPSPASGMGVSSAGMLGRFRLPRIIALCVAWLACVICIAAAAPLSQPSKRIAEPTRAVGQKAGLVQPAGAAGCLLVGGLSAAWTKQGCGPLRGFSRRDILRPVVSPDGRHVYVVGGDGVAAFQRSVDGTLTQLSGPSGCLSPEAVAECVPLRAGPAEPDSSAQAVFDATGQNLYLNMYDRALVALTRDPATGALTQLPGPGGCVNLRGDDGCAAARGSAPAGRGDDFIDVAISSDQRTVYVTTSGALLAFGRDPVTGALHQIAGAGGCIARSHRPSCAPGGRYFYPTEVELTGDGKEAIVAVDESCENESLPCEYPGAVRRFRRDRGTGELRRVAGPQGCVSARRRPTGCRRVRGLPPVLSLRLSSDDRVLYVTGTFEAGLVVFRRGASGALRPLRGRAGCIDVERMRCRHLHGVSAPTDIVLTHDGRGAYLSADFSQGAFAVLGRDRKTGGLRQLSGTAGCVSRRRRRGCLRARIASGFPSIGISPDDRSVYAGGTNQLAVFQRRQPALSSHRRRAGRS
jgi:hypothetical protein